MQKPPSESERARVRVAVQSIYSIMDTLDGVSSPLVIEALVQILTSTLIAMQCDDSEAAGAMVTMAMERHKAALDPVLRGLLQNIEVQA